MQCRLAFPPRKKHISTHIHTHTHTAAAMKQCRKCLLCRQQRKADEAVRDVEESAEKRIWPWDHRGYWRTREAYQRLMTSRFTTLGNLGMNTRAGLLVFVSGLESFVFAPSNLSSTFTLVKCMHF